MNESRTAVLVAYATKHGSTHEVAETIAARLREHELEVEVCAAAEVERLDPYDAVVVGGALYMGRLHRDARRLLARFRQELAAMPLAVFAMGPLTTAEKDVAGARRQLDRALSRTPEIEPIAVAIFGGVVHPEELRFPFSHMPESDARDREAIDAWADEFASALAGRSAAVRGSRAVLS
jgi:menaquinone-dependent protoporphyrinogen oxidase